jgi:hypothetical protein
MTAISLPKLASSVGKSAAAAEAHHHPNYLRGIIDGDLANNAYGGNNQYDEAYIKLACSNAFPVDYEKCSHLQGSPCNEQNRAVKQCFALRGATADIYTCAARGACDTTTTTTTTTLPPVDDTNDEPEHNTKRQVDGQKCCEEDVGCCRGEDVCFDQTFHGEHIYHCERIQETKAPPSKQCLHHKEECEPTHAYEKCCDEMTCASVKDNIDEPFREGFDGREYACLKLTPPTTTPEKETRDVPVVGPVCAHQNNECDPDATDGVKHCCGKVPCLSVDQVSERTRSYLPSEFKFVCSARGESDVVQGDFMVDVV